jgi:hypothetical protein
MPYYEDEDDRANYIVSHSDDDHDHDYGEDTDDDYDDLYDTSSKYHQEDPLFEGAELSPPAEWRLLKIGKNKLRVSSEGKIHFIDVNQFYITPGVRQEGTPYRYVNIELDNYDVRKFYVHDLVWRAFNYDDPPEGWEVRHSNDTPVEEKCYLNHIDYLDIYRSDVHTKYELRKMI